MGIEGDYGNDEDSFGDPERVVFALSGLLFPAFNGGVTESSNFFFFPGSVMVVGYGGAAGGGGC